VTEQGTPSEGKEILAAGELVVPESARAPPSYSPSSLLW
jgi:hypothetical protein